jgi:hypothetical protein
MTQVILVTPENQPLTLDRRPVSKISSNDLVYFTDVYSQRRVNEIVDLYGHPAAVAADVECTMLPTNLPTFFIPQLYRGFATWTYIVNDQPWPEYQTATHCFNFSINKCDPVRTLILRLIEWFKFDSYQYTWSGRGAVEDMSGIINEFQQISAAWLSEEFRTHILGAVTTIEPRWIDTNESSDLAQSFRKHSGSSEKQWQMYLSDLIGQTAVSLITDPVTDFGKNYVFSERWVYTVSALTFNLWVGTHGQAEQAQRMGFDIFDDVIDHSYQYHDTVLERCYYALEKNRQILSDLDKANTYKSTRKNRLLKNRELMLSNAVAGWVDQQIDQMPHTHQHLVRSIMNSGIRL